MTWLLMSVAALVVVMGACVLFGLATASHIDLGDTADIDDDDEDDTVPGNAMVYDEDDSPYVRPVPPFPIRHIGPSGQHDRYGHPFTHSHRQLYIDFLEKSWELPTREPGATR